MHFNETGLSEKVMSDMPIKCIGKTLTCLGLIICHIQAKPLLKAFSRNLEAICSS